MPNNVYFVLSNPPAGVDDAAYDEWYDTHVAEVLATPGFIGARRYWLTPTNRAGTTIDFRHLSLYILDRPSAEPLADLHRQVEAGTMTIPEWMDRVRVTSFDGSPLEDGETGLVDHAYLVLSNAPKRFSTEEFYGWYYAHARENMTSDGFETLWRFALTQSVTDPEGPVNATHAAWYEVDGELPALHAALKESADAGRVDLPDWMPECGFTSWDCIAAAPAGGS